MELTLKEVAQAVLITRLAQNNDDVSLMWNELVALDEEKLRGVADGTITLEAPPVEKTDA